MGKYDAQPVQTGAAPTTDFTQMQQPQQFEPQNGYGNANPTVGPVASPYTKDAAVTTQQPQTNFEGMQKPEEFNAPSLQEHSDVGYKGGPYDPSQYDSLSAALNGGSPSAQPQQAEFQADPNQRDGGFFGWLKGLIPKKRPGKREGETDDEYDARRTRNMEMVATLADAIRHMGNIVNTAKGAPLQQFNDPTAMLEQGYQNRKAQRAQKAAADANAAYKMANMTLKERAAETERAYKEMMLGMQQDKFNYQKDKDKTAFNYKVGQDEISNQIKMWDLELKERGLGEKERHSRIQEAISNYRAHKSSSGGGRGGSGSAPKYITWDADGNPHYAQNKTMYEANEAYYNGNTSGNSSTSNSKEVVNKDGSTTRVTNRQSGSSVAQKAGAQRRQRENARKAKGKGKTTTNKGGGFKGFILK